MVSAAGFEPAYGSSILSRSATHFMGRLQSRLAGTISPGWPPCHRSTIGRCNGLKSRTVWVRIPPMAPANGTWCNSQHSCLISSLSRRTSGRSNYLPTCRNEQTGWSQKPLFVGAIPTVGTITCGKNDSTLR